MTEPYDPQTDNFDTHAAAMMGMTGIAIETRPDYALRSLGQTIEPPRDDYGRCGWCGGLDCLDDHYGDDEAMNELTAELDRLDAETFQPADEVYVDADLDRADADMAEEFDERFKEQHGYSRHDETPEQKRERQSKEARDYARQERTRQAGMTNLGDILAAAIKKKAGIT